MPKSTSRGLLGRMAIWGLLILFVIATLIFAGVSAERIQAQGNDARDAKLAKLSSAVGALIHEIQKERDLSVGFTASKGKRYGAVLAKQFKFTDARYATIDGLIAEIDLEAFEEVFATALGMVRESFQSTRNTRDAVQRFELGPSEIATAYGGAVSSLRTILGRTSEAAKEVGGRAELVRALTAHAVIVRIKEGAVIERALGTAGFTAGRLSDDLRRRITDLVARQKRDLSTLSALAAAEQREFIDATLTEGRAPEIARLREFLIEGPKSSSDDGATSAAWYKSMSREIRRLRTVEERLAADLVTLAEERLKKTRRGLYISVIATAVLVLQVLFLVTLARRGRQGVPDAAPMETPAAQPFEPAVIRSPRSD